MKNHKTTNNLLYIPKENLWINPKVFGIKTEYDIINEIPKELDTPTFRNVYGEVSDISKRCPVSHSNWDYIFFKDCTIFRPASMAFQASRKAVLGTNLKPSYTPHIEGTMQHKNFWKEELRRIIHGYEPIVDGEPCGIRISGEFYFYLNYCVIEKMEVKEGKEVGTGVFDFPDFLAMDYFYYKEIDALERPHLYNLPPSYKKVGLTVAKSRRKGFSYKAAAGAVWVTAFPHSKQASPPKVLIASDTGKDATLCFKKAITMIDWLTEYTPFGRQDPGSPRTNGGWKHIQMSMTEDEGYFMFGIENTKTKIRKGRLSSIGTVSLANRADKAAGQGVDRVYFEEAGKTEKLKDAWEYTRPVLKPGALIKGLAIIFGTGGSMVKDDGSKGHSHDFSQLFYSPLSAELASYNNIYEYERTEGKAGWFISEMWACFGASVTINDKTYEALDRNGNALFWVAECYINKERKIRKDNGDKAQYNKYLTQYCKTPKEAFLVPEGSIFPVADLFARDSAIRLSKHGYEGLRVKGELVETENSVYFKVDLENKLYALDQRIVNSPDKEGCILRYEAPMKINGQVPEGAYIISVDPIGQDTASGKSYSSIIVMKTPKYIGEFGPAKVVCTYRGRAKDRPQLHVHELLMKLSKYYNAKITFENDRDGGILQYFIRKGQVGRLLSKPELTLSKYMSGTSKTLLREYGHSMGSVRHKQIGEDLLLDWLLARQPNKKVVNENDEIITLEGLRNLDMLEDRVLIEELIAYTRSGNFDTVMAMMGAIIQINEHWNEDFMRQARENDSVGSVSDFWEGVFINKYGSNKEKMLYKERTSKNKNEVSWYEDTEDYDD